MYLCTSTKSTGAQLLIQDEKAVKQKDFVIRLEAPKQSRIRAKHKGRLHRLFIKQHNRYENP